MSAAPFFLLSRRPGWRSEVLLSSGIEAAAGVLRLATPPPPSVFDCPLVTLLELPGCRRAVLDVGGRRALLVSGTGQVVRIAGPWRIADGSAEAVCATQALAGPGCGAEVTWPSGTWQPIGLVLLPDGRPGVLDRTRGIHVLDCRFGYAETLAELPGPCAAERPPAYAPEGIFVTVALDSGLPGCRWHRIEVAGVVPSGCNVEVHTLTSDADHTAGEIAGLDDRWVTAGVMGEWPAASAGSTPPWDALVQSPPGQYLWLRLVLRGDGTRSPALTEVGVHFPRQTSLRHLPAVFAAGDSDFLDRFLALTDTVRASVTELLDHLGWQLDPRSADADDRRDFLGWLGGWVGMDDIAALPVARQRQLIAAAAELYRRRGTPDGVARHAGLWLGRRTAVLEHFKLRRWAVANSSRLGDASVLFGPGAVRRLELGEYSAIGDFALVGVPSPRTDPFRVFAHAYTLFVYARGTDDGDALAAAASRIARAVSPGHVAVTVCVIRPTAIVGVQARVGLDALVAGAPTPGHLGDPLGLAIAADPRAGGATSLGIDARVGTRATIG